MIARLRRRLAVAAALGATAALIGAAALHAPWVRARALSWVEAALADRFGLALSARGLSYNLVTRHVVIDQVALAVNGREAEPFFAAARVELRLPWSIYRGMVTIDRLDIDRPEIAITRDALGRTNLPASDDGPPPPTPRRLDLGVLHVRDLTVRYADRQHDVDLRVPGLRADLAAGTGGLAGVLAVGGITTLRVGARTLEVAPAESQVTFDGSGVRVDALRVAATEGTVTIGGRLLRVLDAPSFDFSLDGAVALAAAAKWIPPPVPVAGVARLTGSLTGPIASPLAEIGVVGQGIAIGRERGIEMDGALRIARDQASSAGIAFTPARGGRLRVSFVVPFDERAARASAAWRGVGAATAFALGDIEALPLGAALDGSLEFDGAARPPLRMRSQVAAVRVPGRAAMSGRVSAVLDDDRLVISPALELEGLALEGSVNVTVRETAAASGLDGQIRAHVLDAATALRSLAPLGATAPDPLRATRGEADASIEISGSVGAPVYRALVRSAALDVPSLGMVAGSLRAEVTSRRVTLSEIALRSGSARAEGAATADLRTRVLDGTLRLDAEHGEDLQRAVPGAWRVTGPARADLTLAGTVDVPGVGVELTGAGLSWLGQRVDTVEASVTLAPDEVIVSRLLASQGAGQLSASGRYHWASDRYSLSLAGSGLEWTTGLAAEGDTTATAEVDFKGQGLLSRPEGTGRIAFDVATTAVGSALGRGTLTVDLADGRARLRGQMPSLGAVVDAVVETAAPFAWRAEAALDPLDVAPLSPLAGVRAGDVSGAIRLKAVAAGTVQGSRIESAAATLQSFDADIGGVPLRLTAPVDLDWKSEALSIGDLRLAIGSGQLRVSGAWSPGAPAEIIGRFDGALDDVMRMARVFDVAPSLEAAGALDLGGLAASVRASVPSRDLASITAALAIESASLVAAGVPVAPARPLRLTLAQGRLTLDDVSWTVAGMPVEMRGVIDLAADDPGLDLALRGTADLRMLSAFVPSVGFDGAAEIDATIDGTAGAPRLGGRVILSDAGAVVADPPLVLSGFSGPIVLDGRRIRVERLSGTANGGAAAIDGTVDIAGREVAGGELALQASGMALEFPDGLRTEADVLLAFRPRIAAPALSGDVRVLRGSFTDTITLAGLVRRARQATAPAAAPTYLDRLQLNVKIDTVGDIVVDNNYGRFAAGAALTVVGAVAQPGMTGRVTLGEGGVVFLAGRTFQLTRGDVSFTNLQRIEPEFNLAAEARVGADDVRMTVSGALESLAVDLTSASGSSTPAELAAAIVGGGRAGEGALALLSADLLGLTGRAIGLDVLRLERGDVADSTFRDDPSLIADRADPAARLTVAKRLSRQVEVTLSQNLRESGKTTVMASYRPRPTFELRAASRDNATLGFGVRHELVFGGGGAVQAPTVRGPRTPPRIAEVRVRASSPALEAELRNRLSLTKGRRFDFVKWQRDIDRLAALMRARGRFEARVRARRIDVEEGRLALEYRVEPGPLTAIAVSGVELPPPERAAIEEAWSRSGLDYFLAADVRARVERHVASLDVVGAAVEVAIDRPAPDAKRLTVSVTGGTKAAGREIRFEGQRAMESATLLAVLQATGVELEGWRRPAAVAEAVEALYRDAGYLAARVVAGVVRVEGSIAVLPVAIVEGTRARVAEIEWRGVDASRRTDVEAAAGLAVPAPYAESIPADVTRRVVARYRADGFGAVEVRVAPIVDEQGATVRLVIDVTEGPRQVLTEIVARGNDRIASGTIAGALGLPVGRPVVPAEWAQARKRAYDTNLFQQVDLTPVPAGEVRDGVQPTRAEVSVREYPGWRLRYGVELEGDRIEKLGALAEERNLGVVADLRSDGLFGRALTLGVFGQYEYDARRTTMLLSSPSLFDRRVRTTLFGFAERNRLRGDEGHVLAIADRSGASIEQRWRRRPVEVAYGYRVERNHTYDPAPSPIDPFPLDFRARIARVSAAAFVDRRDNPLNSRRGTFSSASWEQAASWLGSDLRNAKVLAQHHTFVPAGPFVVASRVQVGGAYGADRLLPDDRFKAGGATTVRGYREDSLGPRDIFGLPAGGELLLVANVEARVPIYRWLGAVGFVDAGNVFAGRSDFRWADLKAGYGVGVRLDSPLGLLRIDFGVPGRALPSAHPLAPNSLRSARWHIGLGQVF